MNRSEGVKEIKNNSKVWDLVVIGGGASGLGVALDGLSRGMSVLLLEKSDFAKGTSSRSTKLLHGGVRYLAQGDVGLVMEALKERGLIMKNAPHVSRRQSFIIPLYTHFDKIKYGIGLKVYDLMAGKLRVGWSRLMSKEETISKLPTIKQKGLKGGVEYFDGQFDDARLALNIAQTCSELGGTMLNYVKVTSLNKDDKGFINGLEAKDGINGDTYSIQAKTVVNATGVFADKVLKMDNVNSEKTIQPSQGAHIVVDLSFLGSRDALMIPQTSDGRVLFGIPWHGKLVLGTTDTVRKNPKNEPSPLAKEIDFILDTCADYLVKKPTREDVLSTFAGMRPLAAPTTDGAKTKEISRSHKVSISDSHLVSIIGGKWTTFRKMGEDTIDAISKLKGLELEKSNSQLIKFHGYTLDGGDSNLGIYGSDAKKIKKLADANPGLNDKLHPAYPYIKAEVVWMIKEEMAIKLEDVLARRFRILFLDARAAIDMAPLVAETMAKELDYGEEWVNEQLADFLKIADKYLIKLETEKELDQQPKTP